MALPQSTDSGAIKHAPPPSELPIYQREDPSAVSFIGRTNYSAALEEKKFIFGIKRSDRLSNVYVLGKSGVGKTQLMAMMARQDIAYGHPVCIIDPSGELIENVLDFIPRERVEHTLLLDVANGGSGGINVLANVPKEYRQQFAHALTEVFERQFGSRWTAHIEYALRNAILALLDMPNATITDIANVFTKPDMRASAATHARDELTRNFWANEYADWEHRYHADAIVPIMNVLGPLVTNQRLTAALSNTSTSHSIDETIQQKGIVLVNAAKHHVGDRAAGFVGALILARLSLIGLMRERARAASPTVYCYIDELPKFITATLVSMYGNSHRQRIAYTVSQQVAVQIGAGVRASLIANTGTIIAFRVDAEDAKWLEGEFQPTFKARDFIHLAKHECYVKLMIDGNVYDPFSATLLKLHKQRGVSYRELIVPAEHMRLRSTNGVEGEV